MSENVSIWNSAGKAGLVLGGISVLYLALNALLSSIVTDSKGFAVLYFLLNTLLWAVKFGACLYFMRFFMLRYSSENPEADNSKVFRFGVVVALYSALIYAACYMAYVMFIAPDTFSSAIEVLQDNPMIDSATMDQIEEMIPVMPTYSFFANLIYCFLFGTLLSAIYSRNIPSRNPFSGGSNIDNQ